MYLAVDIGGTKTLVASFTKQGKLTEKIRFETPQDYNDFITTLHGNILLLKHQNFQATAVAAPGMIDRKKGIVHRLGNLNWQNAPLAKDVKKITKTAVFIENDANLAGLSEALYIISDFKKILYATISTGIGTGIIVNGTIYPPLADSEGGRILLQYKGKLAKWEDFASGKAIKKRFGKLAKDIHDQKTWSIITHDIARGLLDLIAVIQPEAIIIGGGVGTHFKEYEDLLKAQLKKYETPMTPTPKLLRAQQPEEAVLYGCYHLIQQNYAAATS